MKYDVIYYWTGGTQNGEWRTAIDFTQETYDRIRLGGRVAKWGRRSIGPPEGPPSTDELVEVGFLPPQKKKGA